MNIPFEKNQNVYIIEKKNIYEKKWIPPDYSLGGDIDGPFDRGHYITKIARVEYKVEKKKFYFGLLDKYNINEIYINKEDADWALCIKVKEAQDGTNYKTGTRT